MSRTILFALLILLVAAAGCGAVQIEDRAFVTAIGLDTVGSGENTKYLVTTEVFRPVSIQPRVGNVNSVVHTIEADNFEMALEQLQARLARVITLSHLKVVVIGEQAAREIDFREIIDYFERHPEVQLRLRLMVVQGDEAMELLKTKPLFSEYLAEELIALARKEEYLSLTTRNPFFEFLQDLRRTGGRGLLPRVIKTDDGNLAILHGGAVFNDYRLAGWLGSEEVHSANWIVGNIERSAETAELDNNTFSYAVRRTKVRIIPRVEQQQIGFTVKIQTVGILRHQQGSELDMEDPKSIKKMEDAVSRAISNEARKAVAKSQQAFGIDYLGFGQALKRHNPKLFKQIRWEEVFPGVPIEIETDARITLAGKKW